VIRLATALLLLQYPPYTHGGTDNPAFTSLTITGAPGVFNGSGCVQLVGGGQLCGDLVGGVMLNGVEMANDRFPPHGSITVDGGWNIDIHPPVADGGIIIWGDPNPSDFSPVLVVLGSTLPFSVDSQGNAKSLDAYSTFLAFETTPGVDFTSEPAAFGQFPGVFGVSLGALMLAGNQTASATHNVEVSTNGYTQTGGELFGVCNGAPSQGRCPSSIFAVTTTATTTTLPVTIGTCTLYQDAGALVSTCPINRPGP
jgi:hypothetical protein